MTKHPSVTAQVALVGVSAALLALFDARAALAGPATEQVQQTVNEVLRAVQDPSLKGAGKTRERRDKMRAAVLSRFSFAEMARRSLGTHWNERTTKERDDFVKLFTELLERSYIARIEGYSGEPIQYQGESVSGDHAEVRSSILERTGDHTSIVYRLEKSDGDWQVYDLVIDGVSLVNNYRIQFGQLIRTSSYSGLVQKMQQKLQSEEDEERAPASPPE